MCIVKRTGSTFHLETGPAHLSSFVLNQFENTIYVQRQRKRQVICWIENHFKKIDNYIEN